MTTWNFNNIRKLKMLVDQTTGLCNYMSLPLNQWNNMGLATQ
jgi:hypothetical protein